MLHDHGGAVRLSIERLRQLRVAQPRDRLVGQSFQKSELLDNVFDVGRADFHNDSPMSGLWG
jgi:hypothetical protein